MRLVSFQQPGGAVRAGALIKGDQAVLDLRLAALSVHGGSADAMASVQTLIEAGPQAWDLARSLIQRCPVDAVRDRSAVALAAYGAGGALEPWLEARRDETELTLEHARLLGELGRVWAALAWLLPEEETAP